MNGTIQSIFNSSARALLDELARQGDSNGVSLAIALIGDMQAASTTFGEVAEIVNIKGLKYSYINVGKDGLYYCLLYECNDDVTDELLEKFIHYLEQKFSSDRVIFQSSKSILSLDDVKKGDEYRIGHRDGPLLNKQLILSVLPNNYAEQTGQTEQQETPTDSDCDPDTGEIDPDTGEIGNDPPLRKTAHFNVGVDFTKKLKYHSPVVIGFARLVWSKVMMPIYN